jgi:anhydro-N-acetylmuramic acid kinase
MDVVGQLDVRLGKLFAEAAIAVIAHSGLQTRDIQAIGSHGQTVRHRPDATHPFTLQLGDPSVISELTGITTVADFRRRDMAAGGQGAPLAPAFHAAQFRSTQRNRLILNIGGIANVTYLPADQSAQVIGFDTGPGNTLLDQWTHHHLREPFDRDGKWAESGVVSNTLLDSMLADPYFELTPPKSSGREYFHLAWLTHHLSRAGGTESAENVQATLLALTAQSIAMNVRRFLPPVNEIYVCGGGAHNRGLMTQLATQFTPASLQTTEALGIHPDWVEAVAFAWLAHRTIAGAPGNLPSVTGARHARVLGGIFRA